MQFHVGAVERFVLKCVPVLMLTHLINIPRFWHGLSRHKFLTASGNKLAGVGSVMDRAAHGFHILLSSCFFPLTTNYALVHAHFYTDYPLLVAVHPV